MTVKELVELLKDEDPNRIIILQKDSEGSGFSPCAGIDTGVYVPNSTWSGEVYLEELTPELEEKGFGEEDVAEDGIKALILWPTN